MSDDTPEEKQEAKKASVPAKEPEKVAAYSGGDVQFSRKITINPGGPLPQYDVGKVKAYQATNIDDKEGDLIAYVCERHLVPRIYDIGQYQEILNSTFIQLIDKGPRFWPLADEERYIFLYRHNLGERLLAPGALPALKMRQDILTKTIVDPMINMLQDLRDYDYFHGAINPTNMFYMRKTDNEKVVVGDCLTLPSGYGQPLLYETVERAMMDPISKGKATQAEDLYAFGVTLGVLLRSVDPLEGLSDDEIIKYKMEHGSYFAVTGSERFQGSILELLRGLLYDDPAQRWTIEEVISWQDGLRLTPKQSMKTKKTPRPLVFLDQKYYQLPILSMDLDKGPDALREIVENDVLGQWLTRTLDDSEGAARVEEAQGLAAQNGVGPYYADRLVACLSLAMFPMGPMRFKGMRFGGSGIGTALVHAFLRKKNLGPFNELFLQKIAMDWLTLQQNPSVDPGLLINHYDSCRNFLQQTRVGFGLERCVYLLCSEVHCLSDVLSKYYVTSPEEMLVAFEDIAKKGTTLSRFLDRHSIAFLSVKDSKVIDTHLYDLNAKDDYKNLMAEINCFALIQRLSGKKNLVHLAKNFMSKMPIVYKKFHDQAIVEKIDKTMKKYVESGDLVKMATLLDNTELLNKDYNNFMYAVREYKALQHEADSLESRLEHQKSYGMAAGRQITALVSSALALMIILFMALIAMSGKQMF